MLPARPFSAQGQRAKLLPAGAGDGAVVGTVGMFRFLLGHEEPGSRKQNVPFGCAFLPVCCL